MEYNASPTCCSRRPRCCVQGGGDKCLTTFNHGLQCTKTMNVGSGDIEIGIWSYRMPIFWQCSHSVMVINWAPSVAQYLSFCRCDITLGEGCRGYVHLMQGCDTTGFAASVGGTFQPFRVLSSSNTWRPVIFGVGAHHSFVVGSCVKHESPHYDVLVSCWMTPSRPGHWTLFPDRTPDLVGGLEHIC